MTVEKTYRNAKLRLRAISVSTTRVSPNDILSVSNIRFLEHGIRTGTAIFVKPKAFGRSVGFQRFHVLTSRFGGKIAKNL